MQFSSGQRNLAIRAMDEAEEHTLHYYRIPPYRWQQLKYDLVTRQDSEWEPLPDSALARVQRLHQIRSSRNTPYDFYRIQLNDPSILTVAVRENLDPDLYPFLVYILTHEMVHLVRLSTILPDGGQLSPEAEESRVQRVAYRILSNAADHRLRPILSRFCITDSLASPYCDFVRS
ncbi:MAG: hypothetical protein LAP85_20200 [Acidobacteriia bacterium]|nr:hypothetical protein [Terriglobia bacterium]